MSSAGMSWASGGVVLGVVVGGMVDCAWFCVGHGRCWHGNGSVGGGGAWAAVGELRHIDGICRTS